MRTIVLFLILLGCGTSHITAQNDYLVTTIPNQEDPLSEEELAIVVEPNILSWLSLGKE